MDLGASGGAPRQYGNDATLTDELNSNKTGTLAHPNKRGAFQRLPLAWSNADMSQVPDEFIHVLSWPDRLMRVLLIRALL
jgi:hypothetical protein